MQAPTPYSTPLESDALFQNTARAINLQFGHTALVYILRRPDNDLQAVKAESFLRRYRSVKPEHLAQFYEFFSGLIAAIQRYISLEESCTKSGAYRKDMALAFTRVERILDEFEHKDNVRTHQFLEGMLR